MTVRARIDRLAAEHGTEAGDDPQFDELYRIAARLSYENAYMKREIHRIYLDSIRPHRNKGTAKGAGK